MNIDLRELARTVFMDSGFRRNDGSDEPWPQFKAAFRPEPICLTPRREGAKEPA
jgi:hypothetical protein